MKQRRMLCGRATPRSTNALKWQIPQHVNNVFHAVQAYIDKAVTKKLVAADYWWITFAQMVTSYSVSSAKPFAGLWVSHHASNNHPRSAAAYNLSCGNSYRIPKANQKAKVMIQLMRGAMNGTCTNLLIRQTAEEAYQFMLRCATQDPTIASDGRGGIVALDYMVQKYPEVLMRWAVLVWRQEGKSGGGGRGGAPKWELVDGEPSEERQPAHVFNTQYDPDAKLALSDGIPQRSERNLDIGKWNLLGDSIVESARASRRAFRRPDCDTGQLDTRKLAEVGVGINLDRAFVQTRSARSRRVAIEILIDVSGSTQGDIITTEASMVKAFCEAFRKAQLECKVYCFHDETYVAKDYHQRSSQVNWERLWGDHGTELGSAMSISRKSLLKRNADRKIMVVLSDGDEGCGASQQAKLARQGRIEVYGFFIHNHPPEGAKQTFTGVFGGLSPNTCVSEVCGAVRRSLESTNQNQ